MNRTSQAYLAVGLVLVALACGDEREPTSLGQGDVGVLMSRSLIRKPIQWSAHELLCRDGSKVRQLQSIFPLDGPGNLVLVGRSRGCPGKEDYLVFDLSSGEPVLLDAIDAGIGCFNFGAHSPQGSTIAFGAECTKLVVYDGGFSLIDIRCAGNCTANGVWAASPTDVWVVTGPPGDVGQILHYDGDEFTVEHEGGSFLDIWGVGGPNPQTMFAVGDRIMQRDGDGTWREVLSPGERPADCQGGTDLLNVVGRSPTDVWAVGFNPCILHYDGKSWTEIPAPDNATRLGGVWPLDAKRIVVSGRGGVDLGAGLISLWDSVDGGESWTQFSDPVFAGLPDNRDGWFLNLAATNGGQRIYAPGDAGTLLLGTVGGIGRSN